MTSRFPLTDLEAEAKDCWSEAGPTGVCDGVGAVGGALGVGGDHRGCCRGNRLHGGGNWVDGEGGGGGAGSRRLDGSNLAALLRLRVLRAGALGVPRFRGYGREGEKRN